MKHLFHVEPSFLNFQQGFQKHYAKLIKSLRICQKIVWYLQYVYFMFCDNVIRLYRQEETLCKNTREVTRGFLFWAYGQRDLSPVCFQL